MTFTHVVSFTWTSDTDAATVEEIDTTLHGFAADADIAGMRSWHGGRDAGLAATNADYAVVAVFDDADAFAVYRDHPEHRRIITELITPRVATRTAVQFAD